MINIVLLIIFFGYVLISAIWNFREIANLKGKSIGENERIKLYRATILEGFVSVMFILPVIGFTDMAVYELGIAPISVTYQQFNIWLSSGVFAISGGLLIILIYQMICYLSSDIYRKQIYEQLNKQKANESHYSMVLSEIMLPKTGREKRWFTAVSVSAGIGEEIIYRGFAFYLISNIFPELHTYLLPLAGGVIFGAAHSYQGLSGSLKTGLLGILFGALYIASGSLLPGIILHFTADFAANFILRPETDS